MPELLRELKLAGTDELHEGLGLGEISPAQVAGAIQRLTQAREAPAAVRPKSATNRGSA